jgi:hypothetical protein
MQVEVQRCEHKEYARTVTADCAQKEPNYYSEMASWVPPDNSSLTTSKIVRAMCCLLKRGEAPRVDSLTGMTNLPEETVQAYLDSAPWIVKDDSSQDGIVEYLPREPPA